MEVSEQYKGKGNVVTKAILTRKKVKKLPGPKMSPAFTALYAIFPGLAENLLMSNSPGDTGYGYRQDEQGI